MPANDDRAIQFDNSEVLSEQNNTFEGGIDCSIEKTKNDICDVKIEIKEEPIVDHYGGNTMESTDKQLNKVNTSRMTLDSGMCNNLKSGVNNRTEQNSEVSIDNNREKCIEAGEMFSVPDYNRAKNCDENLNKLLNSTKDSCLRNDSAPVTKKINQQMLKAVSETTKIITNIEVKFEANCENLIDVIDGEQTVEQVVRSSDVAIKTISGVALINNESESIEKIEKEIVSDINRSSVLKVFLETSSECEKKTHRKVLDTIEELCVRLEREDLHELQKSYEREKQIKDSDLKGRKKSKWHRWQSNQRKQFGCRICPFAADHRFDLLSHIVENHKALAIEKKLLPVQNMFPGRDPRLVWYKCTNCAYITKLKASFQSHLISHKQLHEVETFSCASCPYVTKLKNSLIKHMIQHKDECEIVIHRCPYCDHFSTNNLNMNKHIRWIHKKDDIETFKCKHCPFETVYKISLQKHILTHSKSRKLYKCHLCPYQTAHPYLLKTKHLLVHTGDESRIFYCAHCPYKSKTKDTLRKHQLIHRGPDEVETHKCGMCPFETKHKNYLLQHRRIHQVLDESKMLACSLCPYKGKTAMHLRMHMNIHKSPDEGSMYKCDKCLYQSRNSANVKRHKITHMNAEEIQFIQCDSCDYRAKSKCSLKAHYNNVHKNPEEVKWFKCDTCDWKFKNGGNLKRHMLCHMNPSVNKKFHCNECSFSTKTKAQLNNHMAKHMNIFISCDKCNYLTKFRSSLFRHKKDHH